jgi:DNA-binding CsgD family transcriptional regulator
MTVSELRRTGIAALGDVAWGTHLCCFFRTTDDLLALLVPYFKAGLESREHCIWVTSGALTEKRATAALRAEVPDLDRHLAERSLHIVGARDWYLQGGRLDRRSVIRGWLRRLRDARAEGFTGLRVAGGADWLESKKAWKDFVKYETVVNETLRNRSMIALCSYPLDTSGATDLLEVASAHRWTLVLRDGVWQTVAWRDVTGLTHRYTMLSGRERQVLHLVAGAYTNKDIADRLSISVKTVEVHRTNLMRKLGVRNHIELLRDALHLAPASPDHRGAE